MNTPQTVTETIIDCDPVIVIEQLADQSAHQGYYGLQDASLILAEAVRELQLSQEADLVPMVSDWFDLVARFQFDPRSTAKEILRYLRRPELKIPMEDDEFDMLEQQLISDANDACNAKNANDDPDRHLIGQQIVIIEQLADQAADENLYGLQDANLLLAEALRSAAESSTITDIDFPVIFAEWAEITASYRTTPSISAAAIINFLRYPGLKIPMDDEEFSMLQEQLTTELSADELTSARDHSLDLVPLISQDSQTIGNDLPGPVSRVALELVDLLLLQTEQVRSHLQHIVIDDKESLLTGLQQASDALERFANAAKTAGFEGLGQIGVHINVNMQRFTEHLDSFTSAHLELLLEWLGQVQEYLPVFNESSAGQLIVAGLTDEQWALPLAFEELAAILLQIRSESSAISDHSEVVRVTFATDDDVSIALPEDVNQELLELLLQEMPVYTRQFSEAMQHLQSGGNAKDVEVAQRVAHTLKGSANTVGIKGIAVLTHHLEDILSACANEQKLPGRALANSLITAADCLENMSEALCASSPPPSDAKNVLQDILDWANRIDQEGLADSQDKEIPADIQSGVNNNVETDDKPETVQSSMVRVPTEQIESLFRLSGESIILNSQAQETARLMKNQLRTMQLQFELLHQLGAELEQLIDLKDFSGRTLGAVGSGLDALEMDQYNELHTASRRMAEAAIDAREISLDLNKELEKMHEVLDAQQRSVIDAQEVVMQTRLVSIATIAPRLQRSFRQTCRMTGKHSELTLMGENIMIDGDTLNALIDPMMHLLRNAIDHGIESEEERLAQGKSNNGKVVFEFDREGNYILVRCRDDGRGLDYAAIRAAAEKKGMLQPGQDISEDELKRYILQPNFSSRSFSTHTSGRGVGMDVVRAQIVNMGGTLTLDSVQGGGMTIELRVPLPLSMTYALLTHVGAYQVAIANKSIHQIIHSGEGQVVVQDDKEVLLLEGNSYPAARLINLLHVDDHRSRYPGPYAAALLVKNDDQTTAVLIDAITDSQEVVIKSLGYYMGKIPGYIGATILGDGTVTPVLDISELLRAPIRALAHVYAEPLAIVESVSLLPTILVVDDSLSQRRSLEQLLMDAGYRVLLARDGIEAAEILAHANPDIVLTDLEMPRMNGIELAAHIRTQQKYKRLPILMITSRTTQKHRQMAETAGVDLYFSKPVRDEELLMKMQDLLNLAVIKTCEVA